MATIRVLLGFIWIVAIGSSWGVDRNIIRDGPAKKLIAIAQKELGIQEYSENSSPRIDQYNAYVGVKKVAWCASFVSWCFGQAGYPQPRTAWSPALFPAGRLTKNPMAGTVIGVYFDHLQRIGHCGIVVSVKGDLLVCVEGNTNVNGSREGSGVYRRIRHIRTIHSFAEWLKR